jgi:hypothetical protein
LGIAAEPEAQFRPPKETSDWSGGETGGALSSKTVAAGGARASARFNVILLAALKRRERRAPRMIFAAEFASAATTFLKTL